jgi:hypothetical protein
MVNRAYKSFENSMNLKIIMESNYKLLLYKLYNKKINKIYILKLLK